MTPHPRHAARSHIAVPAAVHSPDPPSPGSQSVWPPARVTEPPPGLTYGEFPLGFFSVLVDSAADAAGLGADRSCAPFADLGSGAGRLVLWAAATQHWALCRGVELLPALASTAAAKLDEARAVPGLLRSAVDLCEGSWDDASLGLAAVDVAFAYTTAIPADEQGARRARQLAPHEARESSAASVARARRLARGLVACRVGGGQSVRPCGARERSPRRTIMIVRCARVVGAWQGCCRT